MLGLGRQVPGDLDAPLIVAEATRVTLLEDNGTPTEHSLDSRRVSWLVVEDLAVGAPLPLDEQAREAALTGRHGDVAAVARAMTAGERLDLHEMRNHVEHLDQEIAASASVPPALVEERDRGREQMADLLRETIARQDAGERFGAAPPMVETPTPRVLGWTSGGVSTRGLRAVGRKLVVALGGLAAWPRTWLSVEEAVERDRALGARADAEVLALLTEEQLVSLRAPSSDRLGDGQ